MTTPSPATPTADTGAVPAVRTMRAVVQHRYGSADDLSLQDTPVPTPADDQVLLRVHAASVNPVDTHSISGTPWMVRLQGGLRAPKQVTPGTDVAGTVVLVGKDVTRFRPGDEVYGGARGSFAEYAVAAERRLAPRPAALDVEQAAAMPVAAITALQALRDKANLQPGQRVLVNGASGGVGTFAVQIATAFGAHVTAVCSTRNVEMVRALGADEVIDHTTDDFAVGREPYDAMIDMIGNRSLASCRKALRPGGVYVVVGGPDRSRALGPVTRMIAALVRFRFTDRRAVAFMADLLADDLVALTELVAAGQLRSVIEQTYPLAGTPDAVRHQMGGHTRGKVVVRI